MKGILPLALTILMAVFTLTEGNWYGKRGNKVDSVFQRYLQGHIGNTADHSAVDTDETLRKISKILEAWEEKKLFSRDDEDNNESYEK